MILNAGLNGQSSMPWFTRLSGHNLRPTDTNPTSVTTDSSGNYIVTGTAVNGLDGILSQGGSGDIFVTKYNSSGVKQWTKLLGGTSLSVQGKGVTTDASGNIFVAGTVTNGGIDGNTLMGTYDFFVTKYNSAGTKQWTKELGVTGKTTYSSGITSDSSGNIYVGGYTNGGLDGNTLTGTQDFFLTKYDTSGTKQWTKQLGVSSQTTQSAGVASDGTNIFITGYTTGNLDGVTCTGTQDFFVIKYNSAGTKQWTRLLGVATKNTNGNAVATDGSNVFVTGQTYGGLDGNTLAGFPDFFITKYDTNGSKLWTKQLGIASRSVFGNGVSADSSGNSFVTGSTSGGLDGNTLIGTTDMYVTKYNSAGTKQWTKQLGVASNSTYGVSCATDSSGNILVGGYTHGGLDGNTLTGATDFFVTKYDTSGTKNFTTQLGNRAPGHVYIFGVTTDSSGNVFAAGHTDGNLDGNTYMSLGGSQDFFIMKYNSSGTKLWTKQLGAPSATVYGSGIATDPSGNAYVAGFTSQGLDGNTLVGFYDFFLTKYDTSGTKLWTKELGVNFGFALAAAVATDASSNIFVAGSTTGNLDGVTHTGVQDAFLVKYNSSGTKQWTKLLGVVSHGTSVSGVATDSSGNIYIAGITDGNLDGNTLTGIKDLFLTKYDSTGAKQWTKLLGGNGVTLNTMGISLDSSGNIFLVGNSNGGVDGNTSLGITDAIIVKYNSSGTKLWSKLLTTASAVSSGSSVTNDSFGNAYMAGYSNSGVDGNSLKGTNDIILTKYNSTGTKVWTKQIGVSGAIVNAYTIKADNKGNLYLGGVTDGSIDLQTKTGASDAILIRYGGN